VAGGGSFIGLPALLYAGIPPVAANATTTLALWPGAVSSAVAYRGDMRSTWRTLVALGAVSLAGGLLGALLLVRTSDTSFLRLLPWLMLTAALTFTVSSRRGAAAAAPPAAAPSQAARYRTMLFVFAIAIYGGYFGGGMGIMMLATLAASGMSDIHEMNGLKSTLGATINGIALAEFILRRVVWWTPGLVMVGGAIVGGYTGASIARRIPGRYIRLFVIAVGWSMTAYFFIRQP